METPGLNPDGSIKLKRRSPEDAREYLMIQVAQLIADRRKLANALKQMLKHYGDPNPPDDMLANARKALEGK